MNKESKIVRVFCLRNGILFFVCLVLMAYMACRKDYVYQAPPPRVGQQTTNLNALYSAKVPLSITDKFWKSEMDYVKFSVQNLNTDSLYGDGLLNMTGTKSGLTSFNHGKNPDVTMKAAYDDSKLYIFIQWADDDIDPRFAQTILNGPIDPYKSDTTAVGWTSQGNSDRVALAFDINGASSSAGTFVDKGCAASCHNNQMKPEIGKVDIWHWNLAVSDPLGYAADMIADAGTGLSNDSGQAMSVRNKVYVSDNRSAPAYEWDGTIQKVTRPDGKITTLDPAYYLLNKTPFIGNTSFGDDLYHNSGNCAHCHGVNGEGNGEGGDGPPFADIGFARKYSRADIKVYSASTIHEGKDYYNALSPANQDNVIAFIKGLASLPGYYLTKPDGSNADIWSVSNVSRARINSTPHTIYQVLLIRNLSTNNGDDVQFPSPEGKSYPFGIALMDNDGKNHIGSLKQVLTFLPK